MHTAANTTDSTWVEFDGANIQHDPKINKKNWEERAATLTHVNELLSEYEFPKYTTVQSSCDWAMKSRDLYENRMWEKTDRISALEEALKELYCEFEKDQNTSAAQALKQTCKDFDIDLTTQVTLEMTVRVTVDVPAGFDVDDAGDLHPSIDFDDHHFLVETLGSKYSSDDFELFDGEVEMVDFKWSE